MKQGTGEQAEAAFLEGPCQHKAFLEVTSSPTIEPADTKTELPNVKQLTGSEHGPSHQQTIGLNVC